MGRSERPAHLWFVVDDVEGLLDEFRAAGVVADDVTAELTPWGTVEFHVRDPDENGLQFYRDR